MCDGEVVGEVGFHLGACPFTHFLWPLDVEFVMDLMEWLYDECAIRSSVFRISPQVEHRTVCGVCSVSLWLVRPSSVDSSLIGEPTQEGTDMT